MEDEELQAIRQARMAQLRQGGGDNGASGGAGPSSSFLESMGASTSRVAGGRGGQGQGGNDEEQMAQQEEQKRQLMSRILDNDARERLSRIAMVKPSKARQIQDLLLRMAQSGQIKQKISEQQLIGLLDQVEQAQGGGDDNRGKITYTRKKVVQPEEDDDDLFDL